MYIIGSEHVFEWCVGAGARERGIHRTDVRVPPPIVV